MRLYEETLDIDNCACLQTSTWEAEAGSGLQSLPRLHGKFEANLGYIHESLSQCGMGWILTTKCVSFAPLGY